MAVLSALLPALAGLGTLYTFFAAATVRRWPQPPPAAVPPVPVTLLKPLYGAEPRLADNLRSFTCQDWAAPVQLLAGVAAADDPAVSAVAALGPAASLVVDPHVHGSNGKVGNLLNLLPHAQHELLVLSDSDMAVPPDYLRHLAAALAVPGVGAATCLYRGRGDAGGWSVLAAAGISYHFLPAVLVGLRLGLARPCMGSTIALHRATLSRIGGFARFADTLADDYAIGAAVRALGQRVAVPPPVLVHGCAERSLGAVWRHELRWAATVRQLDLGGHFGSLVAHPVPWALIACLVSPTVGSVALAAALLARWWLRRVVDRLTGSSTAPGWLLPLRDLLSFAVLLRSFAVGTVEWRGRRLAMRRDGAMRAHGLERAA